MLLINENIKQEFAQRLRKLRKLFELTQEEFGKKIGYKRLAYGKYEKGISSPDAFFIKMLLEKFNCDPNWFITGEGSMFRKSTSTYSDDYMMVGEGNEQNDKKSIIELQQRLNQKEKTIAILTQFIDQKDQIIAVLEDEKKRLKEEKINSSE